MKERPSRLDLKRPPSLNSLDLNLVKSLNPKIKSANEIFNKNYPSYYEYYDICNKVEFAKTPRISFSDENLINDLPDDHKKITKENCFKSSELTPDYQSYIEVLELKEEENPENLISFKAISLSNPKAEGQSIQEPQLVDLLILNVLEEDPTPPLEAVKTSPTELKNKIKMKESYIEL